MPTSSGHQEVTPESTSDPEVQGGTSNTSSAVPPNTTDMHAIRAFIASVEWRFAKTMAWCPHYYHVLEWSPEQCVGFLGLVT